MAEDSRKRGVQYGKEELAEAYEKTVAIVERWKKISAATKYVGFDTEVMNNIHLISATPEGVIEWELLISPYYANLNGVMHGGAAGVIFDMCTTTALGPLGRRGFWDFMGGVTRSLNISYLKAIPLGTTVRIKSRVMQVGKTMALIRGDMTSVDGKLIYCTCEHHKVAVPSKEEHMRAEYDGKSDGNPGALPNAETESERAKISKL